jgi:hypothetical protein
VDLLEFLAIVEALGADPLAVFREVVERRRAGSGEPCCNLQHFTEGDVPLR